MLSVNFADFWTDDWSVFDIEKEVGQYEFDREGGGVFLGLSFYAVFGSNNLNNVSKYSKYYFSSTRFSIACNFS